MTEYKEIKPGVPATRVILGRTAEALVRIVNLNETLAVLYLNDGLGVIHPVEVLVNQDSAENGSMRISKAMKTVEEMLKENKGEMSDRDKVQLKLLLLEYIDVFSLDETDLGHYNVSQHKIDTGTANPIR